VAIYFNVYHSNTNLTLAESSKLGGVDGPQSNFIFLGIERQILFVFISLPARNASEL